MAAFEVSLLTREALEIARLVPCDPAESAEQVRTPTKTASGKTDLVNALFGKEQNQRKPDELKYLLIHRLPNIACHVWSPDGSNLATWPTVGPTDTLSIHNANAWDKAPHQIKTAGPLRTVIWSTTGRFVLCHSAFIASDKKNVQVFHVESGQLIFAATAKSLPDGQCPIQFGANDAYLCRVIATGLSIHDLRSLTMPENASEVTGEPLLAGQEPIKLEQKDILSFSVAPERRDGRLLIALCAKGHKGAASTIRVVAVHLSGHEVKPICQKNLFQVQECQLQWNLDGSYVLAWTHVDVDQSGASYYGKSQLFLLAADAASDITTIVSMDQGPVHAFAWSKTKPNLFSVASGKMPPTMRLIDARTAKPTLSFGTANRNTLIPSESGNLLCIAGFGNLPGDMDIWDLDQERTIGLCKTPWVVDCFFSPDSYWMLCSTTTPRLRVDNGIRVLRANGDVIFQHDCTELYKAYWRPVKAHKQRSLSPGRHCALSSGSAYKARGAVVDMTPVRQTVATKLGSVDPYGGSYIPGMPVPNKATDKKGSSKQKGGKAAAAAPVFEFSIAEPGDEIVSAKSTDIPSTEVAPVVDEKDSLKEELEALDEEALGKRKTRFKKMVQDIQAMKGKKNLNPDQLRKRDRLPMCQFGLECIDELAQRKGFSLPA